MTSVKPVTSRMRWKPSSVASLCSAWSKVKRCKQLPHGSPRIYIASKPQSDHPRRVVLCKSKSTQKLLTRGLLFDGTLIMVTFLQLIQEILQRSDPLTPKKPRYLIAWLQLAVHRVRWIWSHFAHVGWRDGGRFVGPGRLDWILWPRGVRSFRWVRPFGVRCVCW